LHVSGPGLGVFELMERSSDGTQSYAPHLDLVLLLSFADRRHIGPRSSCDRGVTAEVPSADRKNRLVGVLCMTHNNSRGLARQRMVGAVGIEPTTSPVRRERSPAELSARPSADRAI